jgi:23S rRNA (adenine2503-C2)-methyltransferase
MAGVDPYTADDETLRDALGGQPAYRVRQVRAWLARGVDDPADMTDLPKPVRARLAEVLAPPPRLVAHRVADAGLTHKVLLEMPGSGDAGAAAEQIESVLMLYPKDASRPHGRATVCISTQAGCAMGCPFCATGQAGLRGQLSVGEVVRQVTVMQRMLAAGEIAGEGVPDHVTNVVFMGMGEPLANADVTLAAVRWLVDPADGFGLSARSVTVSTVGLVPGMRRLAALAVPVRLAVSLHAPDDALRDDLVPVNRTHPIADVLAAADAYREATGRRVTFEYVLIDGINDAPEQASRLARLLTGRGAAHVNLIPMNATPGVSWTAPAAARQRAFADVLVRAGLPATIRANRGGDIDAACGQLYASYQMASGKILPTAVGAAGRLQAAAAQRGAGPEGAS